MSGRKSRNKGKVGEREAAKLIADLFKVEARRGVQHAGGPDSPDIVTGIPDVHFEVKRVEKLNLYTAMDQAERDAGDDKIPVVLHRKNLRDWVAVVYLDQLPGLVKNLGGLNNG